MPQLDLDGEPIVADAHTLPPVCGGEMRSGPVKRYKIHLDWANGDGPGFNRDVIHDITSKQSSLGMALWARNRQTSETGGDCVVVVRIAKFTAFSCVVSWSVQAFICSNSRYFIFLPMTFNAAKAAMCRPLRDAAPCKELCELPC